MATARGMLPSALLLSSFREAAATELDDKDEEDCLVKSGDVDEAPLRLRASFFFVDVVFVVVAAVAAFAAASTSDDAKKAKSTIRIASTTATPGSATPFRRLRGAEDAELSAMIALKKIIPCRKA